MATAKGTTDKRSGAYVIHAEIGAGGMASVHLGQLIGARGFARTVAIKVLHASYARNKAFVERFLDEARLVARIHHPNVIPTLDVFTEADELRIVMDYVAGESLDRLQKALRTAGQRIPPRVACAIVSGALHGLHAAHEAKNEFGEPLGIIHLDVSPQNILVGQDGTTRLLDFGVARAKGGNVEPVAGGKPAYLAPEQVGGLEVSPRTDVFAASVVLWELLTGEPLFAADNHAATMQRVLVAAIPPKLAEVPDLPPRLDEILKTGLQRDPKRRFATAREMALEIEQSVPPALPSEVGRWVESVAADTLRSRAAMVQEMEARSATRTKEQAVFVPARELYAEQAASNLPGAATQDEDLGSSLKGPGGGDELVPARAADGSVLWKPRSQTLPSPGASSTAKPSAPKGVAPPSKSVVMPMSRRRSPHSRAILWGIVAGVVAILGLLGILARVILWPRFVRAEVVAAAAAHGVSLTVGDASLADEGVALKNVTWRLAGVSQVSGSMAKATVRGGWSSPTKLVLGKTEVTIDGEARSVLSSLNAWATAHASTQRRPEKDDVEVGVGAIDVPDGHVVWTRPSAQGVTRAEAGSVRGSITWTGSAVEAHLLSEALTLETRVGPFGPWSVNVDRSPKELRVHFGFDPAVLDGPSALWVDTVGGDTSFEIKIPRSSTGALGVPQGVFGDDFPLPQQIELSLRYSTMGHDQATAQLKAAAYGARLAGLGTSLDAQLTADAAGPAGSAMAIKNGAFVLGPVRGAVSGSITPADGGVRANLAWRGDPISCASLVGLPSATAATRDLERKARKGDMGDLGDLARDFGSIGQAVGAIKVTGTFIATGTVTLDTSALTDTKWTVASKNSCGISLFQGK